MEITLIRHFKTRGNVERRYVGRTDEGIVKELAAVQRRECYPQAQWVIVSPMKRCVETAASIYKGQSPVLFEELRECDFGIMEYRTYEELKDHAAYQTWLDCEGDSPVLGGESRTKFQARCVSGFDRAVEFLIEKGCTRAAMVIHGGTIMSVMAAYIEPRADFYTWQVENGGGYVVILDEDLWRQGEKKLTENRRL